MFDVDDYTCEASNRGKLQTEPFSRNEFLNKRRAAPRREAAAVFARVRRLALGKLF